MSMMDDDFIPAGVDNRSDGGHWTTNWLDAGVAVGTVNEWEWVVLFSVNEMVIENGISDKDQTVLRQRLVILQFH